MSHRLCVLLCGLALAPAQLAWGERISYVWEMAMVVTSTPPGTGRGTWQSPVPVVTSAYAYVLTTKVSAVAHLLPPLIGTWDSGEETVATNLGAIPSLPCVFFDATIRHTNVQSFFFLMITSVASSHARVSIETDAYVHYEISAFAITNLTLRSATQVYLDLHARTNEGRGIFLTAVPEPWPWHAAGMWLLCGRRGRRGRHGRPGGRRGRPGGRPAA
jgi:hypothetical protein